MSRKWPESGTCSEDNLKTMVSRHSYTYYTAYQTDRFLAGKNDQDSLDRIEWTKLLEIRLFSVDQELLARRTMIGSSHSFQWRVASENGLAEDEYLVRYQTLDIDSEHIREGNVYTTKKGTLGITSGYFYIR